MKLSVASSFLTVGAVFTAVGAKNVDRRLVTLDPPTEATGNFELVVQGKWEDGKPPQVRLLNQKNGGKPDSRVLRGGKSGKIGKSGKGSNQKVFGVQTDDDYAFIHPVGESEFVKWTQPPGDIESGGCTEKVCVGNGFGTVSATTDPDNEKCCVMTAAFSGTFQGNYFRVHCPDITMKGVATPLQCIDYGEGTCPVPFENGVTTFFESFFVDFTVAMEAGATNPALANPVVYVMEIKCCPFTELVV